MKGWLGNCMGGVKKEGFGVKLDDDGDEKALGPG